ncbi:unnamed protein product, partial [Didymodactylos carnosus]
MSLSVLLGILKIIKRKRKPLKDISTNKYVKKNPSSTKNLIFSKGASTEASSTSSIYFTPVNAKKHILTKKNDTTSIQPQIRTTIDDDSLISLSSILTASASQVHGMEYCN